MTSDRRISYAEDVEKGDLRNRRPTVDVSDVNADEGEYTILDRYVSTYRDHRRLSNASSIVSGEEVKVPWWAPWRRLSKKRRTNEDGKEDDGVFRAPDEWIKTDIRDGLKESEIEMRRKRSGWNELTTEKENMFLKFLSYFQGPILYGNSSHP